MADLSTVTMNISLPEPLKQLVDAQVQGGRYASASEFVREAIREKTERDADRARAVAALEIALLHGLNSEAVVVTDDYVARQKAALKARIARKGRAA